MWSIAVRDAMNEPMPAMSLSSSPGSVTGWGHWLPAFGWLRSYQRAWLRGDLVAGLTAAAVVVPQAMAYGDIAGLPLAVGLYTALVPLIVPDDETFPGLLLLKTEGVMHFANVQRIFELLGHLISQHQPRVVVLDCSAIQDLEYTALKRMTEAENRLQQSGVSLWLAGLNPEPLQLVQKSALGTALGRARMYFNLEQAVEGYQKQK
jgi:MFS superfamily sulfate permease-like transporter